MSQTDIPAGSREQRTGMRAAIWTQCFGIVAEGMVVNGTLLLYLTALGVSAARSRIGPSLSPAS